MKAGALLAAAGIAALAAIQVAAEVQPTRDAANAVRRRRRVRLTPEQQMVRFGGFVEPAYDGRYVYFMNSQGRVPQEAVEWVASQARIALSLPARVERPGTGMVGGDIAASIRSARESVRDAGATVCAVDVPDAPSILVAPEDGWAQVNVAALAQDAPPADVLEARLKKELWRAFILVFGGGNSQQTGDVMRPIRSPADLDTSVSLVSSPEPFNAVLAGANARGIAQVRRTTYLNACREGWAPAPTNDVQRAIWEKAKADKERGPTNPITIQPPKAK